MLRESSSVREVALIAAVAIGVMLALLVWLSYLLARASVPVEEPASACYGCPPLTHGRQAPARRWA